MRTESNISFISIFSMKFHNIDLISLLMRNNFSINTSTRYIRSSYRHTTMITIKNAQNRINRNRFGLLRIKTIYYDCASLRNNILMSLKFDYCVHIKIIILLKYNN